MSLCRFKKDLLACVLLAALAYVVLGLLPGCKNNSLPTGREKPIILGWVMSKGPSMLPSFPDGVFVQIELGSKFEDLKEGDTVIYWDYTRENSFVHHRIVSKQAGAWIAKGDNPDTNKDVDVAWVTKDNFVARGTGQWSYFLLGPAAIKKPQA